MLLDFFKNGKINKKALIAEYYKKLGLNENQYTIVSLVLELDKLDVKLSTPANLAEYMTLDINKIEVELDSMIKQGFLNIDVKSTKKNLDFTPLYNKLTIHFQMNLIKDLSKSSQNELIEKFFSTKLNNKQFTVLEEFKKRNNSSSILLEIILNNNFNDLDSFMQKISSLKDDDYEEIEVTEYDWLRNS